MLPRRTITMNCSVRIRKNAADESSLPPPRQKRQSSAQFAAVFLVAVAALTMLQTTTTHAFSPTTRAFPKKKNAPFFVFDSISSNTDRRAATNSNTLLVRSNHRRSPNHSSFSILRLSQSEDQAAAAAAAATEPAVPKAKGKAPPVPPHLVASNAPPLKVTIEKDEYSYNEAIQRTLAWVASAILFGGGLWLVSGAETGQEFFAGYLVEQSLSVDNLFVFLLLFEYFNVPLPFQDRVLNWGIYGAIVMRAVMIGLGAAALQQFHGILLVFAGILVYSSAKFFVGGGDEEDDEDPSQNSIVKFSSNLIKSTNEFDGDRFFTLVDGVRQATPLFICMIAVEISDVVFAVDSIPAVFGVTENPLVVFSSNIFAIMGLRSLYTILSKAATDLKYLEPAVALVLGFIGAKMIAEYFGYFIPTEIALSVVGTLLGAGIGLSVFEKQKELEEQDDVAVSTLDDSQQKQKQQQRESS